MVSSPPRRLPRGRHALAPEEVARRQRERLMLAMAQAMSDKGFAATSVEDVLKRAAVSRQSFYRLFSSKLDCFLAAFDEAARFDKGIVDGAVNGVAALVRRGADEGRRLQTGYVRNYALGIAVGAFVLVGLFLTRAV